MVQIYINLNISIEIRQFTWLKCFNNSGQNLFPVGKMFQYPQFVSYLRVSKVSCKFCIATMDNLAVIYL